MTDREAMQQALAFCAFCWNDVPMNNYAFERLEQTITVLRDRLERPEQMSACPHGVPHRWLCEICDQPEQEPVDVGQLEYFGNSVAYIHQKMTAYRNSIDAAWAALWSKGIHPDGNTSVADAIKEYVAPPQRTWVDLTDEEIEACRQKGYVNGGLNAPFDFDKAAGALLALSKEKNT